MTTLRCGRIDAHEPHGWSRPPGWSRPRRTYHCEGTPAAVEGGHFADHGGEECRESAREKAISQGDE